MGQELVTDVEASPSAPAEPVPVTAALSLLPLMQLATAHWAFKTLAAAVELDLFTRLSGRPGVTKDELARAYGIDERPAEMLLAACASLGLLEGAGGRFRNSSLADEFLVRGRTTYFGGFVEMQDKIQYPGWTHLVEAIRQNRPITWDPATERSFFERADPVVVDYFWEAMHALSATTAGVVGEAVDFRPCKQLLDVGGGSGGFDIELCRRYPHLRATVYDFPFVTELAATKIAATDLDGRITTVGGDFADEALPAGYDVMLLSLILHGETEARNRRLLRKCHRALAPGGAIVIADLVLDDDRTGPPAAALMGLAMIVNMEGGRSYSATQYRAWLCDCGFKDVAVIPVEAPGANVVVVGHKQ